MDMISPFVAPVLPAIVMPTMTLVAPPRVRAVYGVIYDHTRITAQEIMDRGGQNEVRAARHLATWLMRTVLGYSLSDTARRMGGRDHSTTYHSERRFIRLCHNRDYHNLAHACLAALRQRLSEIGA